MPKPKLIPTPELLEDYFNQYVKWAKSNPFKEHDFIGPKAMEVQRKKERCLSFEGFEIWCYRNGIIKSLEQYFTNQDNLYKEYMGICRVIKTIIRQDQIEGGMAGVYNPSITQRLNGLVDKSENKTELKVEQITGMEIK